MMVAQFMTSKLRGGRTKYQKNPFNFCRLFSNRNILAERKCQNRTKTTKCLLYKKQVTKKVADLHIEQGEGPKAGLCKGIIG